MLRSLVGSEMCIRDRSGCSDANSQSSASPVLAPETTRTVQNGKIVGFVADNGTHVWRGIPFAADTSGENRWRAPRRAPDWEGARSALEFSQACAQIATPFTQIDGWVDGELEGSEDCLALDIYAPADAAGRNLPVMVWIHGGSNVSGASQLYVGDQLAANEDVIIVAIQYRLGPLGWFSHQALRDTAETAEDKAANFAILDQIAALRWVRDNIAGFGGNPSLVTIFGESAGGADVAGLLASPLAKGLFHRAIIQSGFFDSETRADAENADSELDNPSSLVAKRLGGFDKFHSASTAEIFAAFELVDGFTELPRMIQDGVSLPATPLRDAFSSTETFNAVPIMTGTNRDENKLFFLFDERLVKRKFGRFIVRRNPDLYEAASDFSGRNWRVRSVDWPAAQMAAAGHEDVYTYRFDWDEGGRFLWTDLSKILGAAHGLEIPFVFNRFEFSKTADPILFPKKTFQTRDALSRAMGAYWASFARDGRPAAPGQPNWQPYSENNALMFFDSTNDEGIRIVKGTDSIDAILDDLAVDTRIDKIERCVILSELYKIDDAERLARAQAMDCPDNDEASL